jgi:hypothetical protein
VVYLKKQKKKKKKKKKQFAEIWAGMSTPARQLSNSPPPSPLILECMITDLSLSDDLSNRLPASNSSAWNTSIVKRFAIYLREKVFYNTRSYTQDGCNLLANEEGCPGGFKGERGGSDHSTWRRIFWTYQIHVGEAVNSWTLLDTFLSFFFVLVLQMDRVCSDGRDGEGTGDTRSVKSVTNSITESESNKHQLVSEEQIPWLQSIKETTRHNITMDMKMKWFVRLYWETLVPINKFWLPLSGVNPFIINGWFWRSIWSYTLSSCDNLKSHPQLTKNCSIYTYDNIANLKLYWKLTECIWLQHR